MSIQDSNIHTRTEIPDVLAASGYQEMLNQREEKTGAWLSGHGTYDIGKWSDFFPVCGKIVVKRKITANLAVIFLKNGGPNRDRTDDLTDANRTLSQLSYRPIFGCFVYFRLTYLCGLLFWQGRCYVALALPAEL